MYIAASSTAAAAAAATILVRGPGVSTKQSHRPPPDSSSTIDLGHTPVNNHIIYHSPRHSSSKNKQALTETPRLSIAESSTAKIQGGTNTRFPPAQSRKYSSTINSSPH